MKRKFLLFLTAFVLVLTVFGCTQRNAEETAVAGQETAVSGETVSEARGNTPEKAGASTESVTERQGETVKTTNGGGNENAGNENAQETQKSADSSTQPTEKEQTANENDNDEFPVYDDYSGFLKIATYNVASLTEDRQGVIDQIKKYSPDIIGLQELRKDDPKYNSEFQIEVLAKECGYPYYGFDPCIENENGEYGVGLLSKYPFNKKKHTTVLYDKIGQGDHFRCYGRYEFSVRGKTLCFYNTHCTFITGGAPIEISGHELRQLTNDMLHDKYAVAVGDFNLRAQYFFDYLDAKKLTVLNGGGDFTTVINTFPAGDRADRAYDNIICSSNMKHYWDRAANVGVIDVKSLASDHNMIYTYIDFPD